MFNWFQRSSKSTASSGRSPASGPRVAARIASPIAADTAQSADPLVLARLPACARQLSPDVQRILAALPPSIDLGKSCSQYPQAVEKLLKHWRNPIEFRSVIDSMVIDRRGGRQGFPFDIVTELGTLREYYDQYVSPVRATAWASVRPR